MAHKLSPARQGLKSLQAAEGSLCLCSRTLKGVGLWRRYCLRNPVSESAKFTEAGRIAFKRNKLAQDRQSIANMFKQVLQSYPVGSKLTIMNLLARLRFNSTAGAWFYGYHQSN
ncbi:MAG TPA: hypothetical protein DDW76_35460 [Cyanobacteria bacterium UBA11369]|nr:hypothetical protein [Cyanobacteria bacterium UBA11371]HBE33714.1 hypothetical protein [Cyanobacteria bacterium UBA11368]HBE53907.1 hypothetical protein [Cyanobacteria bacterium UBA11369]